MAKTKAQKAVDKIKKTETLEALVAAVSGLKPEERNDKKVGYEVFLATERLVK